MASRLTDEIVPHYPQEADLNPANVFEKYEQAVRAIEGSARTVDDPRLLDLSIKLFEIDAGRYAWINSRATTLLGAISLAAALVTGVGFTTLKDTASPPLPVFITIVSTYVLALVYLCATSIICFRIQGAIVRVTPDPSDIVPPPSMTPSSYYRNVAVVMLRYTIENYRIGNRVAGMLWVAQKCFRNALIVLVIGGLVVVGLVVVSGPPPASALKLAQALARAAGCTDIPTLAPDQSGGWTGLCLSQGKTVHVKVDTDGRAILSP
jgi:hypothetical protein